MNRIILDYYTPLKQRLGGILVSPCLSVCLFPLRWTWFCPRMFWKIVHSYYSPSEDVHLEFSYSLDNFSFNRPFPAFGLSFFISRNNVLRITKNFDLNIENVFFLNWNFVFTFMIYNILKEFNKVQWYYAHVDFFIINLSYSYAFIIWFTIF